MTGTSLRSFSVFVNVAVKRFTASDGINQLWSNEYYTLRVCVCSLSYPAWKAHASYYIVICGLSGCTIFSTLFHKWHDFRKNFINIKCVFWFSLQLLSETFLILRRIRRDIIINVHRCSCKVPLLLSGLNETSIFSVDFRKILKYQHLWKFVQCQLSCCMRTDRRTNRSY
jgi:hypothetical protein